MSANEAIKKTQKTDNSSRVIKFTDSRKEPVELPELLVSLMLENHKSVRKLAKEVGLSPTVIQNIRSAKKQDMRLGNFKRVMAAMGYKLYIEKGERKIPLS